MQGEFPFPSRHPHLSHAIPTLERLMKERNMVWRKTNRFNLAEKEETSERSAD
jgi:hypothetical protein